MFKHSRREIGGALLLTLLAALAGWPSPVMAQREDESLRSGEKLQIRTLQPPLALQNVATTLRTMGRADLADRLIRDYGIAKVRLGDPGSRATTSPPLIVPLVTNRRDNIMTLDKRQLTTQCDTKRTDQNPVTDGTLGWALTVVHEYVHMGQDNPTQTARFENAGWRESVHENQSWMRNVMSKVTAAERMPNSAEKVARLRELSRQLELLREVHEATINGLKEEIAAGHVGAGQEWPTIEAGTSADLNAVVNTANTLVAANIKNTRDGIARIERELAAGTSEARTKPAERVTARPAAPQPTQPTTSGQAAEGIVGIWTGRFDVKSNFDTESVWKPVTIVFNHNGTVSVGPEVLEYIKEEYRAMQAITRYAADHEEYSYGTSKALPFSIDKRRNLVRVPPPFTENYKPWIVKTVISSKQANHKGDTYPVHFSLSAVLSKDVLKGTIEIDSRGFKWEARRN